MSDVTAISQLVLRERQSRVRYLSDQLRECFHPDATVTTSWLQGSAAAFVAGAGERSAQGGAILNRVGAPVVQQVGRRAVVELPSTTTRWIPVKGIEAELVSFMRLIYRVERRETGWKISSLVAVNEGDTLTPAVPGTELTVDPAEVAGFRHSYRFLAYTRSLAGEKVGDDLYGTDRPDELDALYRDAVTWLGA